MINQHLLQQGRNPEQHILRNQHISRKQNPAQITIQITKECIDFIQGGKHLPCRHYPISLKSYQCTVCPEQQIVEKVCIYALKCHMGVNETILKMS